MKRFLADDCSNRDSAARPAPGADPDQRDPAHERLAILQKLAVLLAGAGTLEEVADSIVGSGLAAVRASAGIVALLDDGDGQLRGVRATGLLPEDLSRWPMLPVHLSTPLCSAFRLGRPLFCETAEHRDATFPRLPDAGLAGACGAVVALPLVVGGAALGAIGLTWPVDRRFDPEERAFLTAVAGLCAQALARARAHDAHRAAQGRLEEQAERIAAQNARLERLFLESEERAARLRRVLATARCLLWECEVRGEDGQAHWEVPTLCNDADGVVELLPIALEPDEPYLRGWRRARLPEGDDERRALASSSILSGQDFSLEYRVRLRDGSIRWIHEDVSVSPLGQGRWRTVGVCTDVTAQKQARLEIEALNQRLQRAMVETHHRVKNNLQIVAAMVDLQLMEGSSAVPRGELVRLSQHIRTLAAIHEVLTCEFQADGGTEWLEMDDILGRLIGMLQSASAGRVVRPRLCSLALSARRGTSLALVAAELVANALKHGQGDVEVGLEVEDGHARLEVTDSGHGYPPGFDAARDAHTGLELVQTLAVLDLKGDTDFQTRPEGGARACVRFPITVPE